MNRGFKYFSLVILLCNFCFSQNEAQKWYFSNNVGLNFATNPPTVLTNGAMTTSVGCSTISDALGNLLFYTDGMTVWNQAHNVMANGTGLLGNPGAQNCVIVKKPVSPSLYYIFTVQGGGGSAGLRYSIVDMALAAGNGSVTVKNATLYPFPCEEKISATRHCNQLDAWVMIHPVDSSNFRGFLLTSTGVSTTAVVSLVAPGHSGPGYKGQMKFSPNGKRMALTYTQSTYTAMGCSYLHFELYRFDNLTGLLSTWYTSSAILNLTWNAPFSNAFGYGAEFSPDGTKVYFTYHGNLHQKDLCNPNSSGGDVTAIANLDNSPSPSDYPYAIQLGPDGKIYVANRGLASLGVIQNPNNAGSACNYQAVGLSLGTFSCQLGLPNFLTSYFEQLPTFTTIPYNTSGCLNVNFVPPGSCAAAAGYTVTAHNWNFGDPGSGSANTSTLGNPSHTYPGGGTYSVSLVVNYLCGRNDTIRKTINVINPPVLSAFAPSVSCGPTSATVNTSGGSGGYSYTWSPGGQTGPVATNLSPGTYSVLMNDAGTGCAATITTAVNPIVINATVATNPVCYSVNSASAGILITGGVGIYSWSGSTQSTPTVSGLAIGNHTVTFTETSTQCVISKTFQTTQMPSLSLQLGPGNATECVGKNVILSSGASGGTPGYNYSWTNGPFTSTCVVTQNVPGIYIYTLTVTDTKNCNSTNTISVNFISNPILSFSGNTTCLNTAAQVTAYGATSFTWLPGNYTGNIFVVNPLSTTIYTVIGQAGSCVSTVTMALVVNPTPTVSMSSNNPLCEGQTLALNGAGSGTFQWAGPSGFSSTLPNPSISGINNGNSGTYSLTVTATNGCFVMASIIVTVGAVPTITVSANQTICSGQIITLSASGASTYSWSTGVTGPLLVVNPNGTMIYTVTGTNNAGCTDLKTISVKVADCTGINELNNDETFKIYPNPNSGALTIEVNSSGKIFVYNDLGELISENNIAKGTTTLDFTKLNDGTYLLKWIDNKGNTSYQKLVKIN